MHLYPAAHVTAHVTAHARQVAVYDLQGHPIPIRVGETVLRYDRTAHLVTLRFEETTKPHGLCEP